MAAKWLNQSAHGGFAPAMHALGNAFRKGEGVPASPRTAAYWLRRAVASGSGSNGALALGGPSVGSRAAFDLATLLLRGDEHGWPNPLGLADTDADADGPPSDEGIEPAGRAMQLLAMAAADGHLRAQDALNAR